MRTLDGLKKGAPFTGVRGRGPNRILVAVAAKNAKGWIARRKVAV